MGELGCGSTTARIVDRTGTPLGELDGVLSVRWDRRLDDTSEALLTLGMGNLSSSCCELLAGTRSWRHELLLTRDGEDVWQGPIVELDFGADDVQITARDVTAWLDHRTMHTNFDFTGTRQADLAAIAETIIRNAMTPDDPGMLADLYRVDTGIVGAREYLADTTYAGDELRELAATGLDYTTVLKRLYLAGEGGLGYVGRLDNAAFVGGLRVVEDGLSAATRAVVIGDDVSGAVGGPDDYYGLLETVEQERSILDAVSARSLAQQIVTARRYPPVVIRIPQDASLHPETPVEINWLIPGVTADIASNQTCREVSQRMKLVRVIVTDDATEGEKVRTTWAPVGVEADRFSF